MFRSGRIKRSAQGSRSFLQRLSDGFVKQRKNIEFVSDLYTGIERALTCGGLCKGSDRYGNESIGYPYSTDFHVLETAGQNKQDVFEVLNSSRERTTAFHKFDGPIPCRNFIGQKQKLFLLWQGVKFVCFFHCSTFRLRKFTSG